MLYQQHFLQQDDTLLDGELYLRIISEYRGVDKHPHGHPEHEHLHQLYLYNLILLQSSLEEV